MENKQPCMQFLSSINAVIRPTYRCNLKCKYCFLQNQNHDDFDMPISTLEKFCDITFPHFKAVDVTWTGGEITIVGLEKFTQYFDLVKRKSEQYGTKLTSAIQTNATLLTPEFVKFLKLNNVSIGISFDGIENDKLRGSTRAFLRSRDILKREGLRVNVISVVSGVNIDSLKENYNYFKKEGINVSFSPYLDVNAPTEELKISPDRYLKAIFELFDYWINDTQCNIKVDPFELMIRSYLRGYPLKCYPTCLKKWVGLAPDGTVLPCGKEFPVGFGYGNVNSMDDIRQMYSSDGFYDLARATLKRKEKCKKECEVFKYCGGGCSLDAYISGNIEDNNYALCQIYRGLFNYLLDKIKNNDKFFEKEFIANPRVKYLVDYVQKTERSAVI